MRQYYFERGRFETHRLRYEECKDYWIIYERQRGFQNPVGYTEDLTDAQRIVDGLNYHYTMKQEAALEEDA